MRNWLRSQLLNKNDKAFCSSIFGIIGARPKNLSLYKLALRHTSVCHKKDGRVLESNERLEYLGDAILGAVVAEHLFRLYPTKPEGFLTKLRSSIVNRESLNEAAKTLGINKIMDFDTKSIGIHSHKSIFGDALEAIIGAIYLDRGYKVCKTFILERLVTEYFDIEYLVENDKNYKSKMVEWAQKSNKKLEFKIKEERGERNRKRFLAEVWIDYNCISMGTGTSKKKAEQSASESSWKMLNGSNGNGSNQNVYEKNLEAHNVEV